MAPSKKKKKVANNPARGFATVSQVSKKAVEQQDETLASKDTSQDVDPASISSTAHEASQADGLPIVSGTAEKERQLSPEEFERALEESELQQWVEKHGQTFRKDVVRQVARLQTDRRLLREQAQFLNTRNWLPPELVNEMLDMIKVDAESGSMVPHPETRPKGKITTEEDVTIRLWTLRQILVDLDFEEARINEVLPYILQGRFQASKETVWGLNEALDWSALHADKAELPDYDRRRQRVVDTPQETPNNSGTSTPRTQTGDTKHPRPRTGIDHKPTVADRESGALQEEVSETDLGDDNDSPTEIDSDLEPEELVSNHLRLRARLYELQPREVRMTASSKTSKTSKQKPSKNTARTHPPVSAKALKLQKALQKIESDILFDQVEADRQWTEKRNLIEQEESARRRMGLVSSKNSGTTSENDTITALPSKPDGKAPTEAQNLDPTSGESSEGEDGDDMLGELFAALPQSETDSTTGVSGMVTESADGTRTAVRDFGKWTGLSPRRVLEEACRSRDALVRISYRVVSSTSFAVRHEVTIRWSKDQDTVSPSILSWISSQIDGRLMSFTMTSIATSDAVQSEAFISTAALFEIFSSSPREERVHLRLPHVWRELWGEFQAMKKEKVDAKDRDQLRVLRALVREKLDREAEEGVVLTNGFKKRVINGNGKRDEDSDESRPVTPAPGTTHPEYYSKIWTQKCSTPNYKRMLESRKQLPMWAFKDTVLDSIRRNQVVIVCGETGCGKSTQVPSFILESELSQGKPCKIYCTEPRRISAISLARRVSEELGEHRNDLGTSRSLVGFAIRLESNITKETRLIYATTGIVMRMLERSSDLAEITHLVLDEVHERSIDSDFLLIILRKLMLRRPDLRVVLMSATVDAQRFSSYLENAPILQVPGRTFPVQTRFLEDAIEVTGYSPDGKSNSVDLDDLDESGKETVRAEKSGQVTTDLKKYSARTRTALSQIDEYRIEYELIVRLIEKIAKDRQLAMYSKAILVFLPGIAEIRRLNDMLVGHPAFSGAWYVYPLHSTIASEEQEQAFLVPPDGIRKIVLATNIAETGITIPDVTCVIDTGKHKEMRFDERRQLSRLIESFISQANAKQRRGRAGRVQEGLCYHLFTKGRHDGRMAEQQTPEMLRLSLQELVLRVKICKLGDIEETLSEALDPPSSKNIRRAIDALVDVKALTASEELTALGRQLAKLPLDVHLGKLVLLGSIFGCLDVAVTVAAILSSKSPFSAPMGARSQADQIRLGYKRGDSDVLTVWNAYCAWRRVCTTLGSSEFQFCRKNFLSQQTLSNIEDLKQQLIASILDAGFLTLTAEERQSLHRARSSRQRQFFALPRPIDRNSGNDLIADSVIAWSFYPKLLVREGKGWRNVANNQSVSLHPTSVNKGVAPTLKWLSFYHIMQSSNKFYNAHETSSAEDFAIALLCGDAEFRMYAGVMILDGHRIRFSVSDWKILLVIKVLRSRLRDMMTRSFKHPGKPLTSPQMKWLDIWQRIFTQTQEAREKLKVGGMV